MKRVVLNLALFAALFTAASCSENSNKTAEQEQSSPDAAEQQNDKKFEDAQAAADVEFAVAAAEGGLYEVQVAKLAKTNGTSDKVKELANHVEEDHSKANDELKELAAKKNITLPTTLSEAKQKKINELTEKKGTEFDKAFAENLVNDHKEDISLFKKEAEEGKDPEIKTWAANKLSALEHHLQMAENAQKSFEKASKK